MIAEACMRDRTVIIPEGAVVLDIVQDIDRFVIVSVVDIVGSCPHIALIIALRGHLLAAAVLVLACKCACKEIVEEIIPVGIELSVVALSAVTAARIAAAIRISACASISA